MTINGKRDGFTRADFQELGQAISIRTPLEIVDEIIDVVSRWPEYAREADVNVSIVKSISNTHRLAF
jgi:serine/threonine-protein kinase HipA